MVAAPDDALAVVDFQPSMADELVPMWRESFEFGVGIVDPHPIEEQHQYLLDKVLPAHRVAIAFLGPVLVGFLASNEQSVAQLHVRIGYHGRGIGSHLLGLAKSRSAGSLWLYTFARNGRARRFYEGHGFVAIEFGFEPTWQLDDVKYRWVAGGGAG